VPLHVPEADGDQPLAVAVHRRQLRGPPDVDQRIPLDALHQVGGHRLPEPVTADEHRHPRPGGSKVENGLSGRISGADHDHRVAAALCCLAAAGP
jgi:hypothetical protein